MSLYRDAERLVGENIERALRHQLKNFGVSVRLIRRSVDKYGIDSDSEEQDLGEIKVILVDDDFFVTSETLAGGFQEGFLYTENQDIRSNDFILVPREDGKSRKYRVQGLQSLGTTDSIVNRFRISSISD